MVGNAQLAHQRQITGGDVGTRTSQSLFQRAPNLQRTLANSRWAERALAGLFGHVDLAGDHHRHLALPAGVGRDRVRDFAVAGAAGTRGDGDERVVAVRRPNAVGPGADAHAVFAAGGRQVRRRRRQRISAAVRAAAEVRNDPPRLVEAARRVGRAIGAFRRRLARNASQDAVLIRVSVLQVGEAGDPLLVGSIGHDGEALVQTLRLVMHDVAVAVWEGRVFHVQLPVMPKAHAVAELVREGERIGDAEGVRRFGFRRQPGHLVGYSGDASYLNAGTRQIASVLHHHVGSVAVAQRVGFVHVAA